MCDFVKVKSFLVQDWFSCLESRQESNVWKKLSPLNCDRNTFDVVRFFAYFQIEHFCLFFFLHLLHFLLFSNSNFCLLKLRQASPVAWVFIWMRWLTRRCQRSFKLWFRWMWTSWHRIRISFHLRWLCCSPFCYHLASKNPLFWTIFSRQLI